MDAECHFTAASGRGLVYNLNTSFSPPVDANGVDLRTWNLQTLWRRTIVSDIGADAELWSPSRWVPDAVFINVGQNDFGMCVRQRVHRESTCFTALLL
jgi:hypothetical protein